LYIPPPYRFAVLPEKVQFTTAGLEFVVLYIPPPVPFVVLPERVQFTTFGLELL
jgi:hypothetical protein